MKKLFTLLVVSLFFISCEKDEISISESKNNIEVVFKLQNIYNVNSLVLVDYENIHLSYIPVWIPNEDSTYFEFKKEISYGSIVHYSFVCDTSLDTWVTNELIISTENKIYTQDTSVIFMGQFILE